MTGAQVEYSTLEVNPDQTEDGVVGPEVWREAPGAHLEAQYPQPVIFPPDKKSFMDNYSHPQQEIQQHRICGISRRKFYIILGFAVLIVVGAVAGGVDGGLHAASAHRHSNTSTLSNTSSVHILGTSKLAATTFNTSVDGGWYAKHVIFQDPNSHLIARRYDSRNGTWVTLDITAYLATGTTPLKLSPGAPLAAASCSDWACGQSNMFFLDSHNKIGTVRDKLLSQDQNIWNYYSINSSAVWNGSQLAAAYNWRNSSENTGRFVVAYQDNTGTVDVAYGLTEWGSPTEIISTKIVAANTSLAIVSQMDESRSFKSGLDVMAELNSRSTQLESYTYDNDSWIDGGTVFGEIPLPSAKQQFAVMVFNDYTEYLYLALLPNGNISGRWVNGGNSKSISSIPLSSGPASNFSAIATALDSFYGISNDQVLQYSLVNTTSSSLSLALKYECVVYPEHESDCS